MSSKVVRDDFKQFLTNNAVSFIDITAEHDELDNVLAGAGIGENDDWNALQFIGNDETPIGLAATNTTGCYRETGAILLHVVTRVRNDQKSRDNIEPRVETLRNLLRGRNISGIIITGVSPPNFESGATLEFEGGYQSATFTVNYYKDINL